jgi:hypothetical protein
MYLKLLLAATIFATVPIVAFAQKDEPTDQAPKPTVADAQKVVEMISNDMRKLQTYCEIGKLLPASAARRSSSRAGERSPDLMKSSARLSIAASS